MVPGVTRCPHACPAGFWWRPGCPQTLRCHRFSVDSGAGLTRQQQLSFVTGAPRANHTGAVVILRRDSASRLVAEAVLAGHQLSSAFGHSLAVLDLNSDGCVRGDTSVTSVTVGHLCHLCH
uniref:Uncharacterized protein n=1 Tax=Catharus ustulatus TaxID=91951 RepID=A0A8C3U6Q4_CATUS